MTPLYIVRLVLAVAAVVCAVMCVVSAVKLQRANLRVRAAVQALQATLEATRSRAITPARTVDMPPCTCHAGELPAVFHDQLCAYRCAHASLIRITDVRDAVRVLKLSPNNGKDDRAES